MTWPLRRRHARVRDERWKLFRPICWYRGCRRQYVLRYRRACPRFASPRDELPEAVNSLNTPAHMRRLPDAVEVKEAEVLRNMIERRAELPCFLRGLPSAMHRSKQSMLRFAPTV